MCCGHKTYGSILSLWTVSFSLFRSINYGTSRTQIWDFRHKFSLG